MLTPPRTKQSYVYMSLRDDIQTGRLRPGSRLTLAELEERFQVSHIPIREALRNLEKEGFIELTPHATAQVKGLSQQEAKWISELRVVLEPLAVAESIPHLTEKCLKEIETLIEKMEKHVEAGNAHEYFILNFQLHKIAFSATPNKYLSTIVRELAETVNRYNVNVGYSNLLPIWHEEHKALLDALKIKNTRAAKEIMKKHLAHGVVLIEQETDPASTKTHA